MTSQSEPVTLRDQAIEAFERSGETPAAIHEATIRQTMREKFAQLLKARLGIEIRPQAVELVRGRYVVQVDDSMWFALEGKPDPILDPDVVLQSFRCLSCSWVYVTGANRVVYSLADVGRILANHVARHDEEAAS